VLLVVIALAAFSSTMAGGLLALGLRDKLHLILGFSAGAVIGVAFFDLLPESLALGSRFHATGSLLSLTALGFLAYLVLDRILLFHADTLPRSTVGAAVLCVHSLLDGLAIGLAFQASRNVGFIVAIAVLTHDFSDGINTMNIVLKSWLLLDAFAPVAGIAATALFHLRIDGLGVVLALFAGFFLYIGASDLIPESYHAHPKLLTTVMTLAGAAVLYVAVRLIG
jgi:zinc transporter ZupT